MISIPYIPSGPMDPQPVALPVELLLVFDFVPDHNRNETCESGRLDCCEVSYVPLFTFQYARSIIGLTEMGDGGGGGCGR